MYHWTLDEGIAKLGGFFRQELESLRSAEWASQGQAWGMHAGVPQGHGEPLVVAPQVHQYGGAPFQVPHTPPLQATPPRQAVGGGQNGHGVGSVPPNTQLAHGGYPPGTDYHSRVSPIEPLPYRREEPITDWERPLPGR